MLQGKIKWPRKVARLRWQFLKYKLPDEKIAKDIVAAYIVFAGFLWWLGIEGVEHKEEDRQWHPGPGNVTDRTAAR